MEKESFEDLFNESIKNDRVLNKIETGKIIQITFKGEIFVDIGYKADGIIPRKEFSEDENADPRKEFKVGDEITCEVLKLNDGTGNVLLSYKNIRIKSEQDIFAKKVNLGEEFTGTINNITDKGIVTEVYKTRVFIPLSLSGINKNEKKESYLGKNITFEVIEFNPKNNRIVGSHKIIDDKKRKSEEKVFWDSINPGKEVTGKVKTINNYGLFVDLNGAQGLLHISEITWKRKENLNNLFKVGEDITVTIKSVDKDSKKIELSYKDKVQSPWETINSKYTKDEIVKGKVTKFMEYGAFVELEEGIEGLVHISEISEDRISKPEQALTLNETVDVKILDIDTENRKLKLSIKAAHEDDWKKDIENIKGVTFELKD